MDEVAKALIEHYQKTYELTYALWQQRNKTFLVLLAVIAFATLLTFRVPQAETLLVSLFYDAARIKDSGTADELRKEFPFLLIQGIILGVVFYLVFNLNHRAKYVLRNYRYLARLEDEIRRKLNLHKEEGSVAFTRESTFYWSDRDRGFRLGGAVKWVYIGMLGLLLLAFLGGRVVQDSLSKNWGLVLVDLLVAIPTLIFYADYAWSSIEQDSKDVIVGGDAASTAAGSGGEARDFFAGPSSTADSSGGQKTAN